MDSYLEDSAKAVVYGTVGNIEPKPASYFYFLENVSVCLEGSKKTFSFSDFLVITKKEDASCLKIFPGNLLKVTGIVYPFSSPSNPGQFDEKSYYKEQNIYYKMLSSNVSIQSKKENLWKKTLFVFRNKLSGVYQSCMGEKNAGVVCAMLLGEKSFLDVEVKSLYQLNGIGHILAISGLHVSILCAFLGWLLQRLKIPRPLPFFLTVLFLAGYGSLAGFGVSTSRAVVMMVFLLAGKELGRSYDALTALVFSAVLLFLRRPYAVCSGSFLLSYSAVLGSILTFPAMKSFFYGTKEQQQRYKRKQKRYLKEKQCNSRFPQAAVFFLLLPQKFLSSLLFSISVWVTTLPVVLYLFYEIPAYGILLNLFLLPFVSVLVVLALAGGLAGLFFLPLGALVLAPVERLLSCYERLCQLFLELPGAVLVFGMPGLVQIAAYAIFLAAFVLYWNYAYRQHADPANALQGSFGICRLFSKWDVAGKAAHIISIALFLFGVSCLFYRKPMKGLCVTMLDVGQGDGIFVQGAGGKTALIDGGSSSISGVGTYRILPFLKYYGISKIDYMVMTHSDEDHISGQLELLEDAWKKEISVGCLLMPCLKEEAYSKNGERLREVAARAKVPVKFIQAGDKIQEGKLTLLCLHPKADFSSNSANARSTVLSLSYGSFSMLFTGDLEQEGEEALCRFLSETGKIEASGNTFLGQGSHYESYGLIPGKYDVLKVAHHGSKNSTEERLLSFVSPKAALISCGEKNRYGHPHKETLGRLAEYKCQVFRTDYNGAVQIRSDGIGFIVNCYKKKR